MRGCRPITKVENEKLIAQFRGTYKARNTVLWLLGNNTGFRISELLSLRVGDVLTDKGEITDYLTVAAKHMKGKREVIDESGKVIKKSQKRSRTVKLNKYTKVQLRLWLTVLRERGLKDDDGHLFCKWNGKPINRKQYWYIVHIAKRAAGLSGKIATHTMRKNFANAIYSYNLSKAAQGKPVDAFRSTSKALGHESITSTDKYLSFIEDDINEAIDHIGELLAE